MVTLGIIILLLTLGVYLFDKVQESQKRPVLLSGKLKLSGFIIGVVLIFFAVSNPIGNNDAGYREVVENKISSDVWVQFNQGWYFKGFFSQTTSYPNVISVVFAAEGNEPKEAVASLNPTFKVKFSDAAPADVEATIKWRLSDNESNMVLTHMDNRTPKKLAETVLEKFSRETLKYAAQLMESETHYSGGMSRMAEDYQSQLEDGQYIVDFKTEYVLDELTSQKEKLTRTYIRMGDDGTPLRKKSNITQYDIRVVSATIDNVDYGDQIDKKLDKKIAASTQESISKQELITAQQEALTEKAKGDQLIAKTRATEEAAKVKATIQAEKGVEVERLAKLKAKETAQKIKYEWDAKAAANQALVRAGLTPQEKAEWEYKTKVGVAAEMAKAQPGAFTPGILVIGGEAGNGGVNPLDAVGLNMFLDIQDKISGKPTKK